MAKKEKKPRYEHQNPEEVRMGKTAVKNPIHGARGWKRATTIALVVAFGKLKKRDIKRSELATLLTMAGITFKCDSPKEGLSGQDREANAYAKWGLDNAKTYNNKKVETVMGFAEAVVSKSS